MSFDVTGLSRRSFIAASASAPLLPAPCRALGHASEARQRLWYLQPAARWEEALPIGNGRLGAMVFGRVGQERLQLNEDTLWAGAPYTPDNPEALNALPIVRRLLADGRYKEATDLASARVMAQPLWQMSYGSLGDVLLDFVDAQVPTLYRRELDLEAAVSTTRIHTPNSSVVREAFASAPHQVIVLRMEASQGRISFDLSYRGPREIKYTSPDYAGSATPLSGAQAPDWLASETLGERQPDLTISFDGEGCLLATGRNKGEHGVLGGLAYALRIQVITDGRVETEDGTVRVRAARDVTVLLSGATSYVNYQDTSGDPVARVRRDTATAASIPYEALKRAHVSDYRALYLPVSLDLGTSPAAKRPTDVRVAAGDHADDPALAALYFQYARYLLISSSRPGTQPANLQGIWNEGTNPPWGSKYTININTEMNYWPADPAGLGALVEPLIRLVEDLSVTGAKTARTMYGARGWVAHHNTDLWRAAAPIDGPLWGLWPCGGAWLCNTLWDHFDYERDPALLARIYPLLAGASLFFLDTLVEDPKGRGLITSPSLSPENGHAGGSSLCAGPAMDRQIVRDLFDRTLHCGKLLARDADLMTQIARARARIAPDAIGKGGQLQEWLEDWDASAPDQRHRHVSHLYAVYPSSQINVRDTPALVEAAKVTLRQRGDLATGWGTAWRLCLWARMGDGEHAHAVLKALLGPQRTYPNLFDAHPPFQIDGNFGGAAGIMEMLLQSWGGEIHVLPALPAAWPNGSIRGMKARGGVTIDLTWQSGSLERLELRGPANSTVLLRHAGKLTRVKLDTRGRYRMRASRDGAPGDLRTSAIGEAQKVDGPRAGLQAP